MPLYYAGENLLQHVSEKHGGDQAGGGEALRASVCVFASTRRCAALTVNIYRPKARVGCKQESWHGSNLCANNGC